MQQASFFLQLIERLRTESPAFFKKLQLIAVILFLLISGFNFLISRNMIVIPNSGQWVSILNWVSGLCFGIFSGALTTTTDPKLIDPVTKEKVVSEVVQERKG